MMGEVYPAAGRGRKAAWAAALALAAALGAARAARADEIARFDLGVHEATLENGLTILTIERPRAPRATCWLFYKTGSVNEWPGVTGISHLFEHLMFKGTHRVGVKDFALDQKLQKELDAAWVAMHEAEGEAKAAAEKRFQELRKQEKENDKQDELWDLYLSNGGTNLNAFTTEDTTTYIVTLPSNKVELFMWLEADRMKEAVFREFYAERDVVKEERRLDENKPDGPYYEELNAMFYMALPYHWPVLGWMSDIDAITPEDCRKYFAIFYAPNNAVLVCTGAVKHEEVEAQAARYFGPIPRGKTIPPKVRTKEPAAPAGERRLTVEAEARPRATLLFHAPKLGDPDGPALEVAQGVLAGNTGRLWSKLVEETELAIETNVEHSQRRYAGEIQIEGFAKGKKDPEVVLEALQGELDRLAAEGPKPEELERARTRLEAGLMKRLEEPEELTGAVGWYAAVGDWRYLEKLPALWRAVSADDVKRVVGQYLAKKKRIVGILRSPGGEGDEGDDDEKGDEKKMKPGEKRDEGKD